LILKRLAFLIIKPSHHRKTAVMFSLKKFANAPGLAVVWRLSLPLMNSFNLTEAAILPFMLPEGFT